jgi:transposase
MFARVKSNGTGPNAKKYLQIVESYRKDGRVKQRVIATLGRIDKLQDTKALAGIITSLGRFCDQIRVVESSRSPEISSCQSRLWGPALVFNRLWEKQGLPKILGHLAENRRFSFDPERVTFALALQRLCEPGSDLQGSQWLGNLEAPELKGIALQHMYRSVAWLAEIREELERELFFRDRDLFTQELDLVFLDTTSTYIYRDEQTQWVKRGYSRDKRPDLPQLVLCVVVDKRGWPVAWEVFPGNTADKRAFVQTVEKLRQRFRIGRVCVVADRGMISKQTINFLTTDKEAPWDYILGVRMRQQKEVREQVLGSKVYYQDVEANLKVAEVRLGERRYILCRNEEEARKDAVAREQIIIRLKEKLHSGGAKSLVGNLGFRRFLKGERGAWRIDEKAIQNEELFDGMFVLRTSLDLPAAEIATTYKGLWRVERTFREEKSTLEIRPFYHHQDNTRIGHIVASFLALRLEVDLQRRMEEKGTNIAWPELMQDLKQLQAVRMNLDGQGWLVRTDFEGSAHLAFRAAGVRPPNKVTPISEPPQPSPAEMEFCSATRGHCASQLPLL